MNVSSMFPIKNTSKVSIDKAKYTEYNDIKGTRKGIEHEQDNKR